MFKPVFLLIMMFSIPLAGNAQFPASVSTLENGGTVLGILPDVGGRIVFLGVRGSGNLLKSDSTLWNEPVSHRPKPGFNADFKAYNGHIVWLGPQSEWWAHQDGNIVRKRTKANWPPDPWLIYGSYEIIEQTGNSIKMMSPFSEISGMRLVKTIRIEDDGSVYFEVEGTNYSRLPVSWDLWMNTRVDGYTMAYVPVKSEEDVRIDNGKAEPAARVKHSVCRNFFSYLPADPPTQVSQKNSKAFITPSTGWLAAFVDDYCLQISFPLYAPDLTHPEQGMIEIYNHTSHDRNDALMELEYHSPFKTLQPGEQLTSWEHWTIYPYKGKKTTEKQIRFLEKTMKIN